MSFKSLMNNTVVVKGTVTVSDAYGGSYSSEIAKYSAVPCRLEPMTGNGDYGMGQGTQRIECTHKLFVENGYNIVEADRVYFGGVQYLTVAVNDIDYMGHHKEIWLKVVKPTIR